MTRLSDNIGESMKMMADIQKLREQLPGTDCGACGAPTCRAFAEDVVRGNSKKEDCIFVLRKHIQQFANAISNLDGGILPKESD